MKTKFEDVEIETGCEMVDATSNHRPDPSWRFVDAAGHEHRWFVDGQPATSYSPQLRYEIPSIRWHWDETVINEDGDEIRLGHNECVDCGARVEPGFTADTHRQMIPGLTLVQDQRRAGDGGTGAATPEAVRIDAPGARGTKTPSDEQE